MLGCVFSRKCLAAVRWLCIFKFHPSAEHSDCPRDRQLHDLAQLDLFDTRDPHHFFTVPSTASRMATATGSDFTAILRRMFADGAAGDPVPSPVPASRVSSTCIPDSSSGIDLFCLCCQLPLAVNNADFMNSLLFRSASGSIGFSLGSGAADSVSGTSAMALSLLFFLCSPLRTSSASASLSTSFLLHAEWYFSIRTLKRSGCACAPLLSLIALQHGHPIVDPNLSCFSPPGFVLPQNGGIGTGSIRNSGLHGAPITMLMASVSHLSWGSNLRISRSLNTPSGSCRAVSQMACSRHDVSNRTRCIGRASQTMVLCCGQNFKLTCCP